MFQRFTALDFSDYAIRLAAILTGHCWKQVAKLANALAEASHYGRQVLICGNGGSAANAIHWANDLFYVNAKAGGKGIRIIALPANQSVMTCLANDMSYEEVFSTQVSTFGRARDLLIVLSGSGNSPNVVRALQAAKAIGMKSFSLTGFTGGECRKLADVAVHFPVNDMQIAEDLQIVVCHMLAQNLSKSASLGNSPSCALDLA